MLPLRLLRSIFVFIKCNPPGGHMHQLSMLVACHRVVFPSPAAPAAARSCCASVKPGCGLGYLPATTARRAALLRRLRSGALCRSSLPLATPVAPASRQRHSVAPIILLQKMIPVPENLPATAGRLFPAPSPARPSFEEMAPCGLRDHPGCFASPTASRVSSMASKFCFSLAY